MKHKKKTTTRGAQNWRRIKALIDAGKCRDCGKPRGKNGTTQRCRKHARAWQAYLKNRYEQMRDAVRSQQEQS